MARILVIGGSGTISGHAVDALVAAAHDVVVFNRGQRNGAARDSRVRRIRGDRDDRVGLSDAVGSVRRDVLIDFVCFDPAQAQALANTVRGQVGHLVFISSVDVFGFPLRTLPVPETAPINPAVGTYAKKKRLCEELLREHQGHDPPLTIVRPTFSMGPRFVIAFFSPSSAVMMNRVRRSLPVVVPGDGQTLIHPSASRDTGAMIARPQANQSPSARPIPAALTEVSCRKILMWV